MRFILRFMVFASAPCVGLASAAGGDAGFTFRPGNVVLPSRHAAYLMNAAGGLDEVDLATGNNRWTSSAVIRALAVEGHELIAQAPTDSPRIDLVVLNLNHPELIRPLAQITLPADVKPLADAACDFDLDARLVGGTVWIKWDFERRPPRGQRPANALETVRRAGVLRVELSTGEVTEAGAEQFQAVQADPLPSAVDQEIAKGVISRPALRIDGVIAAFERAFIDGLPAVRLHRWDGQTGEALPVLELTHAAGVNARYASADGRHLLVSGPAGRDRWQWQIFDLTDGARAAAIEADVPGAWFFLDDAGDQIIHEQRAPVAESAIASPPNTLWVRAVDKQTGVERWKHEVRDAHYRGAQPPGTLQLNSHKSELTSPKPGGE